LASLKKNVTRQTWQALFHCGEYLFQSTRHFGECLKNMVSHTALYLDINSSKGTALYSTIADKR